MKQQSPLDDLSELAKDWQAQPFEHIDVKSLLRKTKRRVLIGKLSIGLNILGIVGLIIGFIVNWFNDETDQIFMIYLGFGIIYSIVFVYFEFKIRLCDKAIGSSSPLQVVESALESVKSSIKYIKLNMYGALALILPLFWFIYSMSKESGKSFTKPTIVAMFIYLAMIVFCIFLIKKRKKELSHINQLLAEHH